MEYGYARVRQSLPEPRTVPARSAIHNVADPDCKEAIMKIMDCRDVPANLSCYVDGDGSAELRKTLELHIAPCRPCRVIFDTTGKTLRIVLGVEPFEVPLSL